MVTNDDGTYDEHGRRLDKVTPPTPAAPVSPTLTSASAAAQEIYLTATPLYADPLDSVVSSSNYALRVTWTQPLVEEYEYIYVYDHEPPQVGEDPGDTYYNWVRTWGDGTQQDEEMSYFFKTLQRTREQMGGFWAAYVRYNSSTREYRIVARARYLASQPNWMAHLHTSTPDWNDLTLDKLFLPATHDTGTFDMVDKAFANRYNQTQTMDFVKQLDAGVRWLDLRIGYYPDYENAAEGPFFTVHSTYASWRAWKTALADIAAWMRNTPTEIVFFNFKWEGPESAKVKIVNDEWVWDEDLKTRVLQETYDALSGFGVLPADKSSTITVGGMIADSYRVVLTTASTYNPLTLPSGVTNPICPGVEYDWFDKYYIADLIPELNASLSKSRTWMWAAGTVLTPYKYDGSIPWGVYSLTADANDKMNYWLRQNGHSLNIVPVDFIEMNVILAFVEQISKAVAALAKTNPVA